MNRKRVINIFGTTGSVGTSALSVIAHNSDIFSLGVVSANTNVKSLAEIAIKYNASHAVIADESLYNDLKSALAGHGIQASAGAKALEDAACIKSDVTLMAVMGFAGLRPLMKAIEQGGYIAIANKEPLVAAGNIVMQAAKRYGATILPVDSEHNAIFQVFENENRRGIERILLTASGGPFRGYTKEQLQDVTLDQALKHPNWDMGAKITIDSATLANKALEVIEAHFLFDMPPERIDVVVHPQSIIHSMVEYNDGSVLSQMGASDMCTPIAYALGWPQRISTPGKRLDIKAISSLTFEELDGKAFPFVDLAYDCLTGGAHKNIAFNASNEICADLFLKQKISFLDIMDAVSHITDGARAQSLASLDDIEAYDREIRAETIQYTSAIAA